MKFCNQNSQLQAYIASFRVHEGPINELLSKRMHSFDRRWWLVSWHYLTYFRCEEKEKVRRCITFGSRPKVWTGPKVRVSQLVICIENITNQAV